MDFGKKGYLGLIAMIVLLQFCLVLPIIGIGIEPGYTLQDWITSVVIVESFLGFFLLVVYHYNKQW